jgi:gamma-glutamyltranspeptidase/glutathione hydrolase
MNDRRIAIAAGNGPAMHAASEVARAGGNSVDACLAAAITSWVAEPFYASLGGSGFVAVRSPDGDVEVIDGNTAVCRGVHSVRPPRRIFLPYSNGVHTGVGGASVAVPGVLAALRLAWERHGSIGWPALFAHAIAAARDGIPLPRPSAYYLSLTWEPLWSSYPEARHLFGSDRPLSEGDPLVQARLGDVLEEAARAGAAVLSEGSLGRAIATAVERDGGSLSPDDLARYRADVRPPVRADVWGWVVESNPLPALGGTLVAAMLSSMSRARLDDPAARLRALVAAERAVLDVRAARRAEDPADIGDASDGGPVAGRAARSPSTTHSSAADSDGLVCAVTQSMGYGSGLVVEGVLLNNTLGEEELHPLDDDGPRPGGRCHSNMAPTIASGGGRVVGLGSPGAERIVGAIAQTIVALAVDDASLQAAVESPRAHLVVEPEEILCLEPGLPGRAAGIPVRVFDGLHQYFGGVQAASVDDAGGVEAAHDPRRAGASAVV